MAPGQVPPLQVEDQRPVGTSLGRAGGGAREEPQPPYPGGRLDGTRVLRHGERQDGGGRSQGEAALQRRLARLPHRRLQIRQLHQAGELYHFSDALPAGAFIFCDEVHAVFHASTSGANRENAFSDSSTSMRKDKLIFVEAPASKRLPPLFRILVDYAGYVERHYFPVLRAFPPACLSTEWIGPRPWDRENLREQLGYADKEKVRRWHEIYDPFEMEDTFKLFDSWLKVQVMYGDGYDAGAERKDRLGWAGESAGPVDLSLGDIAHTVINAYADGFFAEEEQAYRAAVEAGIDLSRNTRARGAASVSFDKITGFFVLAGYPGVSSSKVCQALEAWAAPAARRRCRWRTWSGPTRGWGERTRAAPERRGSARRHIYHSPARNQYQIRLIIHGEPPPARLPGPVG